MRTPGTHGPSVWSSPRGDVPHHSAVFVELSAIFREGQSMGCANTAGAAPSHRSWTSTGTAPGCTAWGAAPNQDPPRGRIAPQMGSAQDQPSHCFPAICAAGRGPSPAPTHPQPQHSQKGQGLPPIPTPTHPHSHPQALQQCSPRGHQLSRDATQADTAQQMDIPPHPRSVRSSTESLQPPIAAGHGAAMQPTGTIRPAPMAVGTAALSAVGHGHKPQKPQPRSGPAPSVPVAAAAQQLP